jgi:hypothetical protein
MRAEQFKRASSNAATAASLPGFNFLAAAAAASFWPGRLNPSLYLADDVFLQVFGTPERPPRAVSGTPPILRNGTDVKPPKEEKKKMCGTS